MKNNFVGAVVGALALLGAGKLFEVRSADAYPPQSAIQSSGGRFQVVNGTPEMTRNIMLLDTQTGQAWQICGPDTEMSRWCPMKRLIERPNE